MELWAATVNDSSYTFDEVLPFYQKSVQFTPPNTDYRAPNASADYDINAYDSDGGPSQVSYANFAQPFSSWMSLGMEAIGIDQVDDFNLGNIMGDSVLCIDHQRIHPAQKQLRVIFPKQDHARLTDNLYKYPCQEGCL